MEDNKFLYATEEWCDYQSDLCKRMEANIVGFYFMYRNKFPKEIMDIYVKHFGIKVEIEGAVGDNGK